jgi:hypothetical protein
MKSITYHIAAIIVVLALSLLPGCGYPEVSPKTYEIAKALYSVSNLKREEGLEKVETLINESLHAGEIIEKEADYLREIVQQCRKGQWADAQKKCRRLMEDQVGRQRTAEPHQH